MKRENVKSNATLASKSKKGLAQQRDSQPSERWDGTPHDRTPLLRQTKTTEFCAQRTHIT